MRAKNSKWARKPSKPKLNFFQMKKKSAKEIFTVNHFLTAKMSKLCYMPMCPTCPSRRATKSYPGIPPKLFPKVIRIVFCKILPRFAGMTLLYLCGKTLHCKIAIYCNTFALGKSRNKRWGMIVSARQWAPKWHHRKDVTLSQQTTKDVAENSQI